MEEKYPLGARVEQLDPSTNILIAGTVMDIPIYYDTSESSAEPSYIVLFDNGTTSSIPLSEMAGIIPSPPMRDKPADGSNTFLPSFLQLNSKIMYEHNGHYHKGFLGIRDGIYRFIYKSHVNKCKADWGIDFPNLPLT
jgi:hypothetical protein